MLFRYQYNDASIQEEMTNDLYILFTIYEERFIWFIYYILYVPSIILPLFLYSYYYIVCSEFDNIVHVNRKEF